MESDRAHRTDWVTDGHGATFAVGVMKSKQRNGQRIQGAEQGDTRQNPAMKGND